MGIVYIGWLYELGMLHRSKPRGLNEFSHSYEIQDVKVVIHQSNQNDASRLKLTGNVIQWASERLFYWSMILYSPQEELLLVTVLLLIRTTLDFSFMTASSVTSFNTLSLYQFPL